MTDPQDPVPRQRLQPQQEPAKQGERAFGADQELRHVVPGQCTAIEIVALDPALNLGERRGDRIRFRAAMARVRSGSARGSVA